MKSFFIFLAVGMAVFSSKAYSQTTVIKTNILYGASTLTPNVGVEMKLSRQWSVGVAGSYHPWTFGGNRKLKHWLVQPKVRHWLREVFRGHFVSFHGLGGEYNVGRIKLPWDIGSGLRNHRYEGWMAGAGFGYGYSWHLKKRWNLELEAALGYLHLDYKKNQGRACGMLIKKNTREYFGPTKLGVNFVYRLGRDGRTM